MFAGCYPLMSKIWNSEKDGVGTRGETVLGSCLPEASVRKGCYRLKSSWVYHEDYRKRESQSPPFYSCSGPCKSSAWTAFQPGSPGPGNRNPHL